MLSLNIDKTVQTLEFIEAAANHAIALATILAYWFIVIQVASVLYIAQNAHTIANYFTAWVSDQMGYTTGFFVEVVSAVTAPNVVAVIIEEVATDAIDEQPIALEPIAPIAPIDRTFKHVSTTSSIANEFNAIYFPSTTVTTTPSAAAPDAPESDPADFKCFIPAAAKTAYTRNKPGRKPRVTIHTLIDELVD